MNTFEILTLFIGSGVGIGVISAIFKLGKIAKTIEIMKTDIDTIKIDLHSVDARLNRLEGAFFERGQWESKIYKAEKISTRLDG